MTLIYNSKVDPLSTYASKDSDSNQTATFAKVEKIFKIIFIKYSTILVIEY